MSLICPRCGSSRLCKNGFIWGKQKYYCNDCKYQPSIFYKRGKEESIKEMALRMYLEGLGFRAIGRLLEVSHVSVYRWIRARAERPFLKEATRGV